VPFVFEEPCAACVSDSETIGTISIIDRVTEEGESRAVARKLHNAATVLFGLKFADNIHYKFKSSQASKARLQSSKRTDGKQNLTRAVERLLFLIALIVRLIILIAR